MESDNYKTIKTSSKGIYKEKGSRFISFAFPVSEQEEIKAIIDRLRKENHTARHHCYAYVLGQERKIWRVYDEGEPSATAGRPILGQINAIGLTNILIVVSRYFGGTLLGVSGLINAYRAASASAIQNAEIIECTVQDYYEITYPYKLMNDVMKILKEEGINQSNQSLDLECSIRINFKTSLRERILNRLTRLDGLKYKYIDNR